MVSQKKQKIVQGFEQSLNTVKNFVLLQFEKTTHQAFEELRADLKKSKATVTIVKNTLFERSLKRIRSTNKIYSQLYKDFFPLKGATAFISLSDDWGDALKTFLNFSQKNQTIKFRFGILDNQIYPSDILQEIASLPPKDELVAKLSFQFKTPITRFIFALKYNTSKLIYILQQKSKRNN